MDPPLNYRRWSVNGRFLGRLLTGVDRYALEILRAIDAHIRERHPLATGLTLDILCPAGVADVSPFANIPLRSLPSAPSHIWEQFILPRYVRGGLLSLCNTGPLAVKRQIVCIHDVNTRLAPESYGWMFRTAYRLIQPALSRGGARIVTVSHYSQSSIAQYGVAPFDQIETVFDGHEHALEWLPGQSALIGADLPLPFVLLVGSKAPHKNVGLIYSIAPELAAKGIHILVIGGEDANVYARDYGGPPPPNVRHLGRVNDNDLAFLYQRALCLVFPSKTEGFGLPVLEAMVLGCPVISTDAASLPEVCGEAALYAAPDDPAAWLAAIVRMATEPTLRKALADVGRQRAEKFSWRRGAEKYLELMYALDHDNGDEQPG
jgi:glycosyltransferase involved in cell wall biosynthesis